MKKSVFLLAAAGLLLSACVDKKELVTQSIKEFTQFELGTVEYVVTKAVAADKGAVFDSINITLGDKIILYSVEANLKAGLNLDKFNPEKDIVINDKSITLNLPKAELLVFNISPESIRFEYSKVSWYRFNFSAAEKNEVLKKGEESILDSVKELGILEDAEKNATEFFESLLKKMGFTTIDINFV